MYRVAPLHNTGRLNGSTQRTNTGQVPARSHEPVDFTDTKLCLLKKHSKKQPISPSNYISNRTGSCSAAALSVESSYRLRKYIAN